jgi:hypothetical protein
MARPREKKTMPIKDQRTWNRLRRSPSKKMPVFLKPRRQKLLNVENTVALGLRSMDGFIDLGVKV